MTFSTQNNVAARATPVFNRILPPPFDYSRKAIAADTGALRQSRPGAHGKNLGKSAGDSGHPMTSHDVRIRIPKRHPASPRGARTIQKIRLKPLPGRDYGTKTPCTANSVSSSRLDSNPSCPPSQSSSRPRSQIALLPPRTAPGITLSTVVAVLQVLPMLASAVVVQGTG